MDEESALRMINDPDCKITHEEALTILTTLKHSVADRANNLKHKILGEYSYYEGEINILHLAEVLLNKLISNNKEET